MGARLQPFEICPGADNPGRQRKMSVSRFLAAVLTLCMVSIASDADPTTTRFKNLQVLPENASTSEVFEVMKLITRALGTECRSCHLSAERNFDSDAKALKVTARAMMHLEKARRPELSWRNPPVTLCIECHQGQLRPAVAPKGDTG